jgi:hypothetical protein
VIRQLGPIQAQLAQEPDIVIRFCDRLPLTSPVRYLGLDEAGFTGDAFLVLRSKHKAAARVQIPFEQIGQHCEILCESGLPAVPLLVPIINLTALAKGAIALHASAFNFNGSGVLTTGWSKGGKTEALLAFMANGADYIGDEWVYIDQDLQSMHGIPEPIRLWNWHLKSMPLYAPRVSNGNKTRLRVLQWMLSIDRVISRGPAGKTTPARFIQRLRPLVERQSYVDIPPQKLFGSHAICPSGSLQKVFFISSHELPEIAVRPVSSEEVANRIVFSLQYERLQLTSYYLTFRFAFPDLRNEWLESAEEIQRERLLKILIDKDIYAVSHPYPVSLPSLYDAMWPLV